MKQKRLTDYKYAKYHASPALKLISPSILFITLAFAGTVLFALSRVNPTVIILLLGLSLVYPIVGVLAFVQSVPKWNCIELKPDGIRITTAGFKLKFIAWSKIKDFFIIPEASGEIIGVGYKRNPRLKWWQIAAKWRRNKFGAEEYIKTQYNTGDNENILDILVRWNKYYSRKSKRGLVDE